MRVTVVGFHCHSGIVQWSNTAPNLMGCNPDQHTVGAHGLPSILVLYLYTVKLMAIL